MHLVNLLLAGLVVAGTAFAAHAQTIYPLTRAEILAGAKFDFKVEFPGRPPQADVKVTINGRDAADVFGKRRRSWRTRTAGPHRLWVRDVALPSAGTYEVEATAGGKPSERQRGRCSARRSGRAAKTSSCSSATACRSPIARRRACCPRASSRAAMAASSPSTTCRTWRWSPPPARDSIVTDSANSMCAYTTGHKSCVNAMGVYCARNKNGLDASQGRDHRRARQAPHGGMAVGVVTNTEIEDATPAGMVAHTRRRGDYNDIVQACSTT